MHFPLKKVVEFSAAILKLTPAAPVGVAVGLGADLFPEDDPTERSWKVKHIPEWKKLCRALMDIQMAQERKGSTLKGKMMADFYDFYGEIPDEKNIDIWHHEIVRVVKAEMAATIPT